jgi:hypothetical protein
MTVRQVVESPAVAAKSVQPLTFLAHVVSHAASPLQMGSLNLQLASAVAQLGSYLTIRGEASYEHYWGEAITLSCLQPVDSDVRAFEATLLQFIRYDRRNPQLPRLTGVLPLSVHAAHSVMFIQRLRDQEAFQSLYDQARQLDRYGAVARPRRKAERLILLAREIVGQNLLGSPSAAEEMYLRLAAQS